MSYLNKLFDLKGKTVVLTGGGGVLAGAIGNGFAQAGLNVALLDINREAAEKAAEKIRKKGYPAMGVEANVLDAESLKKARKTVLDKYKTIDILVNAAGGNVHGATIPPEKSIFDVNVSDLDKVTDLNFKGTVLPSLVFGETMALNKSGNMINISSMAALQSITRVVGYSAAKAAVSNFTQWMAMELAMKFGEKMRVNAIAPGFFIGEQNRRLLTNEDGSYTERGSQVIRKTPMNRFGEADELVGACLYLASNAASFVTGVVLPVDGGFSIYSGV